MGLDLHPIRSPAVTLQDTMHIILRSSKSFFKQKLSETLRN